MVSRTRTPVARSTRSLSDSRCWTLKAPMTLMPAAISSSTSCHRFRFRLPGTLVCASSSTTATSGLRARMASTSISSTWTPRYSMLRRGTTSRPSMSAAVSSATVRLHEADHHVDPALAQRVGLLQHPVGLPHPRCEADVQLEPSALPLAHQGQELVRPLLWAVADGGHGVRMADLPPRSGAPNCRSRARLRTSTFTRGSPRTNRSRRSSCDSTRARTRSSLT